MARSVYDRVKDLESFIPQLDAAQTDNAQRLLALIRVVADAHNELVLRLVNGDKIDDSLIIDIQEALNDHPLGWSNL